MIGIVDYAAAKVATQILNPKILTPALLKELKKCESSDVIKNIEILEATKLIKKAGIFLTDPALIMNKIKETILLPYAFTVGIMEK